LDCLNTVYGLLVPVPRLVSVGVVMLDGGVVVLAGGVVDIVEGAVVALAVKLF